MPLRRLNLKRTQFYGLHDPSGKILHFQA